MERHIVLLRPLGPQASPIISHTLFGATCWALSALGEDVGQLLAAFAAAKRPPFAFSGAYPYVRDRKKLYLLLPRPPFRIPSAAVEDYAGAPIVHKVDTAKKIQKAAYLSPGVAARLRSGEWGPEDVFRQAMLGEVVIHQDTLFLDSEAALIWRNGKPAPLWRRMVVQRNSVDRVAGATVEGLLFQRQETFYDARRSGLWFAVWADGNHWPRLQAAFRFIADTGLGGKRSVGKGQFEFSVLDRRWEDVFPSVEGGRFLSLSHYVPAAPDESRPEAYELEVIRQKAENRYPDGSQRVYVASLRAFRPGGLFSAAEDDRPYGRLLELGPVGSRTVYYSGLTIPLWGRWEV